MLVEQLRLRFARRRACVVALRQDQATRVDTVAQEHQAPPLIFDAEAVQHIRLRVAAARRCGTDATNARRGGWRCVRRCNSRIEIHAYPDSSVARDGSPNDQGDSDAKHGGRGPVCVLARVRRSVACQRHWTWRARDTVHRRCGANAALAARRSRCAVGADTTAKDKPQSLPVKCVLAKSTTKPIYATASWVRYVQRPMSMILLRRDRQVPRLPPRTARRTLRCWSRLLKDPVPHG